MGDEQQSSSSLLTGFGTSRNRLVFNGDERKYEIWELKFLGYMRLRKLHETITAASDVPVDDSKNCEAFAEIIQCLDDKSLSLIMRDAKDDGRKALAMLRKHYMSRGKPRIIALYTELTSLVKNTKETVTDYLIRAENAYSLLKSCDENVSDGLLIAMVMKGLPQEYKPFTAVILQKDEKLTFQEFKVALRNFEETEKGATEASSVLHINSRKSFSKQNSKFEGACYICKRTGHKSTECRFNHGHSNNRSRRWCDICKNSSHDTSYCRRLKSNSAKAVVDAKDKEDDSKHFAFTLSNVPPEVTPVCSLLVDCGATTHIINDESKFVKFDEHFDPSCHVIELADGRKLKDLARKRGNACVELSDVHDNVHKCILYNALFVPSFNQNIFSVQAAIDKGANIEFKPDSATLTSNNTDFKIKRQGQLYYLNMCNGNAGKVSHSLKEWHAIMGHCNKNDILKLEKVVEGMKITNKDDFDCSVCIKGKMTQTRSRKPDKRATAPLDFVHLDLEGPIDPPSEEGYRYVLGCTDDFTGLIIPYFMRNKSDTPQAFEKFLADVRPHGEVKCVRSDEGGEFTSQTFETLLTKNHIKHEFSAPYSAHQNGTAERSWRTIFEMARCLIIEAKLPKTLWPYAVMTSAHIRNRCFNNRTMSTPYQSLTGKKPDLSKMHKFGSICYAYVQKPKKLDDRAKQGIFIGYDKSSPAYMVYFPENHTVRKVRCVKFTNETTNVDLGFENQREEDFDDDFVISGEIPNMKPVENENVIPQNDSNENVMTQNVENAEGIGPRRRGTKPKYLNDFYVNEEIDNLLGCYTHYCYAINVPYTYDEAMTHINSDKWKKAMDDEMFALEDNDTFELTILPPNKELVKSRWVYTEKINPKGETQYKARFVAKGFSQKENIDYHETFSPTANMTSIRTLMQIAAHNKLIIHQMDVKAAYLNAPIDCEIYVEQPKGYEKYDKDTKLVYKLKKSLYGLKQSGRNWNTVLHTYLISQDFIQSLSDPCVYTKHVDDSMCIIVVWVDDIIIATSNDIYMSSVKIALKEKFKMKDLGKIEIFLGIEFSHENNIITMSQSKYLTRLLDRFGMSDCKPKFSPCDPNMNKICAESSEPANPRLYREIVGGLIYAMIATRPDLSFAVTKLSQYMSEPKKNHMTMAKHVLRYIKGTLDERLIFKPIEGDLTLIGFCDADWANSEDRRSITGYGFEMTKEGPVISWKSKKQQTVALSTCEAEYMSLAACTQEGKFLKSLINDMLGRSLDDLTLYCDNQGSLELAKNPVHHQRSKHIDIRYHFVRDEVKLGSVKLMYVPSEQNIADIFTKPINSVKTQKFRSLLMGMK